ncbi:hypothetical protein F5148DRAFT_1286568 [Russula earlei]|uniref:Uncharacterized protein n=1 Tax=Russula earlei TaxID=71964 RepID=A0ACC0U3L5_9AGAM|nr:hypothetical protein F5148DRAFT_1286568 [Russula earlei]
MQSWTFINSSLSLPLALELDSSTVSLASGWVNMCNSQTSFVWLMTFYAFLQIFSGGWDTIALHHSSLHADTIHILILVKKWLHLAQMHADTALSH